MATPLAAFEPPFSLDVRSLVEVSSIESLPAGGKKILGRQNTGAERIADKRERFN